MRRWPRTLVSMVLAAGAGGFGIAALAAGQAHAASDSPACGGFLQKDCPPSGTISDPTVSGGTEQVTVTWTPTTNQTIDPSKTSLIITWAPPTTVPPGAPVPPNTQVTLGNGTCSPTGANNVVSCVYDWPSAMAVGGYVLNGTYTFTAAAVECPPVAIVGQCSDPTSTPTKTAGVANPPSAPTNVKAVLAPSSTSAVNISWNPSPEPDVAGYQVLRADGSVACSLPTFPVPAAYTCTDTPTKDGSYAYRVVAHRWGPTYSTKVSDEPASAPSGATKALTLSGTSANTTTTVPTGTLGPQGFNPKPVPGSKPASVGGGPGGGFHPSGSPATVAPNVDTPAAGDPGFQPTLPYGAQPTTTVTLPTGQALAAPPAAHKGKASVGTIAVIGAGLLIGVIALHGLWLRSEVQRSGTLEALEPEV